MIRPRWSPEINLGHLLTAASIVLTVGGGAITSYISLKGDISIASDKAAQALAGVSARVMVLEARREMDSQFQMEMRRDLKNVMDVLMEVRLKLAERPQQRSDIGTRVE